MTNSIVYITVVFFLTLFCSCEKALRSEADLYKWLENPDNGLVKTKNIGAINLKVKYLPPEYLAYNELKNDTKYSMEQKDSIFSLYLNSKSFLLTIGPNESAGKDFDVMLKGIENYESYKERIIEMNFNISEYISLKTNNSEYRPVLVNMENVYDASDKKNINLVFAPQSREDDLLNADELDLTFNDDIFQTGISHFKFRKKDMEGIPVIKFWKL